MTTSPSPKPFLKTRLINWHYDLEGDLAGEANGKPCVVGDQGRQYINRSPR
jgi:hypothetical protein